MANKKAVTTAIVPWEQKFAKYAKAAVEQEKSIGGGGLNLKFGPGTITVAGGTIPGGRAEVIVLGSCFENSWYGSAAYDPDDPQPPVCYAFGEAAEEMVPHADCQDPQNPEGCATCPKNAFGSADTGRGKACGNKKRLAVLLAKDVEDADAEAISTAELATARVSPTNLKAWAGYVRAVAEEHGRPPWAVVTEISSHADPKTQIRLEFKLVSLIESDDILNSLERRVGKVQEILQQPYGPPIERTPKPAKQKFAGKQRR